MKYHLLHIAAIIVMESLKDLCIQQIASERAPSRYIPSDLMDEIHLYRRKLVIDSIKEEVEEDIGWNDPCITLVRLPPKHDHYSFREEEWRWMRYELPPYCSNCGSFLGNARRIVCRYNENFSYSKLERESCKTCSQ